MEGVRLSCDVVSRKSSLIEPHDHVVDFYDDDEHLVASVASFLAEALQSGDAAVVVATEAHRDAFDVWLRREGVDCERLRRTGHYWCFDASEMLSSLTAGTELQPDRFLTAVGGLIGRLSAEGRPVRVFGEMVALLWDAGNVAGAIELESLWNELALRHPFSLYCAYPLASLMAGDDVDATSQICQHHSEMLPPRSYTVPRPGAMCPGDTAERSALFVPIGSAAAPARLFVFETLVAWEEHDLLGDATLITSELVTNAICHAGSAFRVAVRRDESSVRIAVHDISSVPPARREPSRDSPGGRGLKIVDQLSMRWGTETHPQGKTVWAEIPRGRRP